MGARWDHDSLSPSQRAGWRLHGDLTDMVGELQDELAACRAATAFLAEELLAQLYDGGEIMRLTDRGDILADLRSRHGEAALAALRRALEMPDSPDAVV